VIFLRLVTVEAARALARNALRSALAILGIACAVAIVIAVVAVGRASVRASEDELEKLGDNLVWVEAGTRNVGGVRTGTHGMTTLTVKDADALRRDVPWLKAVSENVDGSFVVIYGDRNYRTRWRGVAPAYRDIKRWELVRGAFFDDEQTAHFAQVVVIGETVRRELFGEADPVGEVVRIQGVGFTVIGLLAPKGESATGFDQDDTVMMPWTTAQQRILPRSQTWLDDILCSAVSADAIPHAAGQITDVLREAHHIQPTGEDDFNIRHPEELLEARVKSSRTLELLLIATASLSLIVGGIGVMNVMLASVSQRVAEIGLRASVGASPGAIQIQFLGEAVVLTTIGGVLGVALGELTAYLVRRQLGWQLAPSLEINLAAMGVAVAVGVFFGFYPALLASRVDPIVALRNE